MTERACHRLSTSLPKAHVQGLLLGSAQFDEPPGGKCRACEMQTARFTMAYNRGQLNNKAASRQICRRAMGSKGQSSAERDSQCPEILQAASEGCRDWKGHGSSA